MRSGSFSGFGPPGKISVIRAAPGSHFGIHGQLSQTMLKMEVHVGVHGPIAAEIMLLSLALVTTDGHMDALVWATA